jgi:SAM-dependent methyltransferase
MQDHAAGVRALFDQKATGWRSKYRAGGPLRDRLEGFRRGLEPLHPPPARVLDFGCGTGDLAGTLAAAGYEVTGCDVSPRMLAEAEQAFAGRAIRWVPLATDWRTLPFEDQAFEAVVASSVFEYLMDLERVFAELHRVLRPNGVLLATVPDLRHPVRRMEGVLARLGRLPPLSSMAAAVPKLDGYVQYLRLSRNRFALPQWHALARAHGFEPLSSTAASGTEIGTLVPLVLRRGA